MDGNARTGLTGEDGESDVESGSCGLGTGVMELNEAREADDPTVAVAVARVDGGMTATVGSATVGSVRACVGTTACVGSGVGVGACRRAPHAAWVETRRRETAQRKTTRLQPLARIRIFRQPVPDTPEVPPRDIETWNDVIETLRLTCVVRENQQAHH